MTAMTVRPRSGVIALYIALGRPEARKVAHDVVEMLHATGMRVALCEDQDKVAQLADPGVAVDDAELLVTIGGDGTLLRGARIAAPRGIPILGINTGRLGFLTEIDAAELPGLELARLLRDGFVIEERVALQVRVNESRPSFALNDVVVRRGVGARMVPFGLSLDGEPVAHIPSDGIVVATPTGSTAYFLSAGGPIIGPNVDAFGIAALLPHTLFARPLIVPSSSIVTILCDDEIVNATLEADGIAVADLHSGDRVTIARAPFPVRFARLRPLKFFTRLETKLSWGVPIKERPL